MRCASGSKHTTCQSLWLPAACRCGHTVEVRALHAICTTSSLFVPGFVHFSLWAETHLSKRRPPPTRRSQLYMQNNPQVHSGWSCAIDHVEPLLVLHKHGKDKSGSRTPVYLLHPDHISTANMAFTVLLLAALSTASTAQIGRRHPYGIYPSPSIKVSYTSVRYLEA